MLTLVTLPPAFGLRNVSPFCLKAEMLLKSLELDFDIELEANPGKAPKGKLPFLIDGEKVIADSELITTHLDQKTGGKVYAGLTDRQRAEGVAIARLVDDHLYWIMVASRWLDDDWWPNVVEGFFGNLPPGIKGLASGYARRQVRKTYHLHGLGRHTLEEQADFARTDLQALENLVPATGFLFGEAPSVCDFGLAGFMAGVYDQQPQTWVNPLAEECQGLKDYTERVQDNLGVWGRK